MPPHPGRGLPCRLLPGAGGPPECAGAGALALLVGRGLGWVAPTAGNRPPGGYRVIALPERLDGWIEAAWVTAWSLPADELTVHYVRPAGQN
jgi:hypothetical protein